MSDIPTSAQDNKKTWSKRDVAKIDVQEFERMVTTNASEGQPANPAPVVSSEDLVSGFRSQLDRRLQESANISQTLEDGTSPYCADCKEYITGVTRPERFRKVGALQKRSKRWQTEKTRWFVIVDAHLVYYENQESVGQVLPKGLYHLDGSIIEDLYPNEPLFSIQSPGGEHSTTLICDNAMQKREWYDALKRYDHTYQRRTKKTVGEYSRYCEVCQEYEDLDLFTLADMDGAVNVISGISGGFTLFRKKEKWAVLKNNHLALYANDSAVATHEAQQFLHVDKTTVEQVGDTQFQFGDGNKLYVFGVSDAEKLNDWIQSIQSIRTT